MVIIVTCINQCTLCIRAIFLFLFLFLFLFFFAVPAPLHFFDCRFFLFHPIPTTARIPLPALSFSALCRLPTPFHLGYHPLTPLPCSYKQLPHGTKPTLESKVSQCRTWNCGVINHGTGKKNTHNNRNIQIYGYLSSYLTVFFTD